MHTYINKKTIDIAAQYKIISQHFGKFILNTHCDDITLIESWISDFAGSGLTELMLNEIADQYELEDKTKIFYTESKSLYYKIRYEYWEKYVQNQILMYYNVFLPKMNISFISLFQSILKNNELEYLQQQLNQPCNIKTPCLTQTYYEQNFHQYSQEQINTLLKTTTNPLFYSNYAQVSLEKAIEVIIHRKQPTRLLYKPYRPVIEKYCSI